MRIMRIVVLALLCLALCVAGIQAVRSSSADRLAAERDRLANAERTAQAMEDMASSVDYMTIEIVTMPVRYRIEARGEFMITAASGETLIVTGPIVIERVDGAR